LSRAGPAVRRYRSGRTWESRLGRSGSNRSGSGNTMSSRLADAKLTTAKLVAWKGASGFSVGRLGTERPDDGGGGGGGIRHARHRAIPPRVGSRVSIGGEPGRTLRRRRADRRVGRASERNPLEVPRVRAGTPGLEPRRRTQVASPRNLSVPHLPARPATESPMPRARRAAGPPALGRADVTLHHLLRATGDRRAR
jgi:hypothetical protein